MALKWKYLTSYTIQTFQGETKNLPVKRTYIWNLEDEKNPEAVRHKQINVLSPDSSLVLGLHKYFHLWKMPLLRILQTLLGRLQKPLSLRRRSLALRLRLLPVIRRPEDKKIGIHELSFISCHIKLSVLSNYTGTALASKHCNCF